MGKTDWDIVTNYTDVVTTTLKTVTFPKVQEQVYLRNQGNANVTYTIGSQSGTLTPGQSVTVNEDISSFTLQTVSGTHTFEVRAKEKGTEKTETETDVMSLLAQSTQLKGTTQSIVFNTDGTVQKVQHRDSSSNVLREDVFTYAPNLIAEVRTLSTGGTITFKYHLDTLETEVI